MYKDVRRKSKLNHGGSSTTEGIETIDTSKKVEATTIAAGSRTTTERVIHLQNGRHAIIRALQQI